MAALNGAHDCLAIAADADVGSLSGQGEVLALIMKGGRIFKNAL